MNISLDAYRSAALQSNAGEVRISREKPNELVNKGTLGHRMASTIEHFLRAVGVMRPDPTRLNRQVAAMEGFKASLASRYGEGVAAAALEKTGLAAGAPSPLTGAVIRSAIDHADTLRKASIQNNQALVRPLLPSGSGQVSPELAKMIREAGGQPDLFDRPSALSDYTTRMDAGMRAASLNGKKSLTQEQVAGIAKAQLKYVLAYSSSKTSKTAFSHTERPRQNCEKLTLSLMHAIANDDSAEKIYALATHLSNAYDDLKRWDFPVDGFFSQFVAKASLQDRSLLRAAQINLLSQNSAAATAFGLYKPGMEPDEIDEELKYSAREEYFRLVFEEERDLPDFSKCADALIADMKKIFNPNVDAGRSILSALSDQFGAQTGQLDNDVNSLGKLDAPSVPYASWKQLPPSMLPI